MNVLPIPAQTSRSIGVLSPFDQNSRTHSEDQIHQVCDSMRKFGFTHPVLIDEDNPILDELDELYRPSDIGGLCDEDSCPDILEEADSVIDDLWVRRKSRLLCGNFPIVDDFARLLSGMKADSHDH